MEPKKSKRGRPALPPEEKKQQRNFRLKPAALDALAELAFELNTDETEMVEMSIMEKLARHRAGDT